MHIIRKIPRAYFLLVLFFAPNLHAQSLPIPLDKSGRAKDFSWNGLTPLSLPKECSNFGVSLIQGGKETALTRESVKEMDADILRFRLPSPPDYNSPATLKVTDPSKSALFQSSKADLSWKTNAPVLELISSSASITRGGAASAVVRSEARSNLSLLALVDPWGIPYYPQTFKKDGYYALLFPWYFDQGKSLAQARIVAMDTAGNIREIPLTNTSAVMAIKNRSFVDKQIMLGDNYGTEKAKELNLSPEEAKKLATNIVAINTALSQASPRVFDRWKATRLSFDDSIARVIKAPGNIFKKAVSPLPSGYRITATFGDRRRYFFQKKQVRESTHVGQDMAIHANMPVYSIMDGTVVYADWNRGNGKTIVIDHGMDVYSFYAHNSEFKVKEGSKVKAGQQISISGTTGQSTGDHLHLSLIVQGMYIQPTEWLSAKNIREQFIRPLVDAEKIIGSIPPAGGPQPVLAVKSSKASNAVALTETWIPAKSTKK